MSDVLEQATTESVSQPESGVATEELKALYADLITQTKGVLEELKARHADPASEAQKPADWDSYFNDFK